MKTAIPPIHETPAELKELLADERDAQKHQRWQALSPSDPAGPYPSSGGTAARGQSRDRRALADRVGERWPKPQAKRPLLSSTM
jgi:hypothetical protein